MKPLVIYHANCADGFGAAFAAWLKLGEEAEYLPMQYGKQAEEFCIPVGLRKVYILDFSFPKETMNHIFNTAKRVVWLDHHKTAFEMWCGKYEKGMRHTDLSEPHIICLDDNKSGALLAWQYFHDEDAPMLIKHIDDYDRWQFKIDGTKSFNKALWSYTPWSFEQWKDKFYDQYSGDPYYCDHGRETLINEGEAILRAHDQNVQSVVKHAATSCTLQWDWKPVAGTVGYREEKGLAANCPAHLSSDVGHNLATQSGTFGLLWSFKGGKVLCSLRSNGDYDVSAIAKAFGGGGHKNAAGFETDINTLMGWLK